MTTTSSTDDRAVATEMGRRRAGVLIAGITAVISGISVFVNGYGVRRFDDPTTYTTAKNLIAAVCIGAAFASWRTRATVAGSSRPIPPRWSLVVVAVIGGSVPFVLFFEGLARVSSRDAAFIHKTLVAWVAVLAVIVLRERLAPPHVAAIALILLGHASLMGGVGLPVIGDGELLVLLATLCWSVEVVVSRAILRTGVDELALGSARMGGGIVLLLCWAGARGALGDLVGLSAEQWRWAAVTGLLLTAYVVTWHLALARAQAVDVTAILVMGAVITALLDSGVKDVPVEPLGLGLLAGGAMIVATAALWRRPQPVPG